MESLPDSSERKQVRKRRGTKRSRSGCLTCKVRKVKCDEARPICARCVSFGIGCDGYDAAPIHTRAPTKAAIARRPQNSFQILPAPPKRWEFQNDMERLHLKEFQTHIAPELSGVFESAFWNHVVMQSTEESSFVRTVATALSAFGTAERISTSNEAIASRHRNFGLIQYQKGLQSMREELSREPNARKALIGCLLICALEGIFGSPDTALTHARSGQKLIQEWLAAHPYQKQRQIGVNSPASHLIEDDLFQATSAFEHQKIGFFDSRKPEDHARIKRESTAAFEGMPASFSDIEEARRYFYLVSRRVRHFWMYRNGMIEKMQKVQKEAGDQTPVATDEDSDLYNKAEGSYAEEGADNQVGSVSVDRRPMVEQDMQGSIFDSFLAEEEQHVWEFVRWQFAFRNLYKILKQSTDKRQIIAAHTLYMQCVSCKVSCTVARDMSNTLVDQHLEDFREMLVEAKKIILLKKQTFRSRFNCELGINLILLMTAQLYRNRTLRREAVALLKLHDCREGIWDSIAMAKIGEHYIALEEKGVETEVIPEASRIRVLNLAFDQGKRAVTFYYSRGPTFTRDNLIKATVTW